MKYIKLFENYNDINSICRKYNIRNYTINKDMSIDVDDYVDLNNKDLYKLPLKFRDVSGNFECDANYLTSLEGCPINVSEDFSCMSNKLTSMKGGPKYVGIDFYCDSNKITTLKYFPEVRVSISIDHNSLPKEIYKNVDYIKDIVKFQEEYQIWNYNDTLNIARFNLMMQEIKNNK